METQKVKTVSTRYNFGGSNTRSVWKLAMETICVGFLLSGLGYSCQGSDAKFAKVIHTHTKSVVFIISFCQTKVRHYKQLLQLSVFRLALSAIS